MTIEVECPYCGHEFEIDSEDRPSRDGEMEEYECYFCEKKFIARLSVAYYLNAVRELGGKNEAN